MVGMGPVRALCWVGKSILRGGKVGKGGLTKAWYGVIFRLSLVFNTTRDSNVVFKIRSSDATFAGVHFVARCDVC